MTAPTRKMKITTSVELRPFRVPNFVLQTFRVGNRQDEFERIGGISVADLSPETLAELCDQFRRDVFAKAGKVDPQERAK